MTSEPIEAHEITTSSPKLSLTGRYKTPIVRSLSTICRAGIQAIPMVGGSLDTIILDAYTRHRERREREFFDELERGEILLTDEQIESNEFLHAFTASYRAALNTRQEAKIHLFARLLVRYSQGDLTAMADEYEEFLALLTDLSYREFQVMLLLYRIRQTHVFNDKHRSMWQEFERSVETNLRVSRDELPGVLERIKRTGLYRAFPTNGNDEFSDFRQNDSVGYLTPNFDKFIAALNIEGMKASKLNEEAAH